MADLTPERLAELRRIAEAATPGPYEVVGLAGIGGPYALRMTHRSGRTWYGVEGIKRREDAEYFVAMNRNTVLALLDEVERLRQQYEALRAGVERVADDLHMAADEAYDNWRITADFNEQGRSIGLEEAEQMVRQLLTEAGGGSQ